MVWALQGFMQITFNQKYCPQSCASMLIMSKRIVMVAISCCDITLKCLSPTYRLVKCERDAENGRDLTNISFTNYLGEKVMCDEFELSSR